MVPLLMTFRNAMNSRKAMLNPTMTTKVIPVAGCCSTFALAMSFFILSAAGLSFRRSLIGKPIRPGCQRVRMPVSILSGYVPQIF